MKVIAYLIGLALFTGVVLYFGYPTQVIKRHELNFTPEYELEIINQDSVRIRSLSTGRVYTERYNQIQDALIKDNL